MWSNVPYSLASRSLGKVDISPISIVIVVNSLSYFSAEDNNSYFFRNAQVTYVKFGLQHWRMNTCALHVRSCLVAYLNIFRTE